MIVRSTGLSRIAALAAFGFLMVAGQGCFVTSGQLTDKINDFDAYLQKREARAKSERDLEIKSILNEIAELKKSVQVLEVSLRAVKEEIIAVKANMNVAFESAERVKELEEAVRQTLDEIHAIETKLRRNVDDLGGRVDDAMSKYREVLLEEKRVLMERLRAVNESLRSLKTDEDK